MANVLTRIEEISRTEGLTITAFERTIGASKGVLSRAINNGTDIQSKWIQTIVENYPQYSSRWLLTGKGDMLIQPAKKIEENFSEKGENSSEDPKIPQLIEQFSKIIASKDERIATLERENGMLNERIRHLSANTQKAVG